MARNIVKRMGKRFYARKGQWVSGDSPRALSVCADGESNRGNGLPSSTCTVALRYIRSVRRAHTEREIKTKPVNPHGRPVRACACVSRACACLSRANGKSVFPWLPIVVRSLSASTTARVRIFEKICLNNDKEKIWKHEDKKCEISKGTGTKALLVIGR